MGTIFELNGLWYFWDSAELFDYGPFPTKKEAEQALAVFQAQDIF